MYRFRRDYSSDGEPRPIGTTRGECGTVERSVICFWLRFKAVGREKSAVKRNPIIAGVLSLVVPGLGQVYGGSGDKGAAIMASAIVVGNLNIIVLPLISMANPVVPPKASDSRALWAYWIPRVVHDVLSFWSIVFWVWSIFDAISGARNSS